MQWHPRHQSEQPGVISLSGSKWVGGVPQSALCQYQSTQIDLGVNRTPGCHVETLLFLSKKILDFFTSRFEWDVHIAPG